MPKTSTAVIVLLAAVIFLSLCFIALGQDTPIQSPQFRFQQPPALDVRPSYEVPKPCQ